MFLGVSFCFGRFFLALFGVVLFVCWGFFKLTRTQP